MSDVEMVYKGDGNHSITTLEAMVRNRDETIIELKAKLEEQIAHTSKALDFNTDARIELAKLKSEPRGDVGKLVAAIKNHHAEWSYNSGDCSPECINVCKTLKDFESRGAEGEG